MTRLSVNIAPTLPGMYPLESIKYSLYVFLPTDHGADHYLLAS